jgi:hypothetical protein
MKRRAADQEPHVHVAELRRKEGKRSRYERCPCCKKLRQRRMLENFWYVDRAMWTKTPFGPVCHVCSVRLNYAGFEVVDGEAIPILQVYKSDIRRRLGIKD